jgi:hypothetical protein
MSRRMRGEVSFAAEELYTLSQELDVPVTAFYAKDAALADGGDAA